MSPDEHPVEVTFDLTPEEWVEVAWEHNRASPLFKKALRNTSGAFVVLVVLLALLSLLQGSGSAALTWLLGGGVLALIMPRLLGASQRRHFRLAAKDGITNGMFGTHRVRLLEEGLLDETADYQWLTRWHAIERVEDGAGSFMIYTGRNAFLPIPHSAFRDAASLRRFADTFYARLKGTDPRLPPEPREA